MYSPLIYNGAPKGLKHCAEVGCVRMENHISREPVMNFCRGVHAEQNAVIQAAYFGVGIKDSIIYTTNFPCHVRQDLGQCRDR